MTDIAIVGIGAVFPGAADAPAFWRNIAAGVDAITEVPPDRWDPGVYYRPGETGADRFYCRRGGFVDDLAEFDPAQFGIMPAAVHGIEPDQLLVLRAAAEAIADCGTLPDRERVGVIIGRGGYLTPGIARLDQQVHTAHQLTAVLRDLVPWLGEDRIDAVRAAFCERLGGDGASIGLVPNFAASRLANRFDLRGPAYTVDAACASSLVAVYHGVSELACGRCDAVLAGGVHACHHPTLWSVFTQLRALSPGELIRPFDARADGTLLAEGTGAVLLKRLADALAAGDRVYAVIRGVGVASDGRATSMMNPLADGQELAMRRAWAAAGLDPAAPDALGLLEAHGTATPAGDQVELTTLERVFGPPRGEPIGLGTVKSMIGHAMPAAGIAGLIKAALAVHHGVLPPTLNIEQPHPALARTRFEPVTSARAWDGWPRRAAVNAFGFGGINAHVILESPPTRAPGRPRPAPRAGGPPVSVPDEAILRLAAASPRALSEMLDAPDSVLLDSVLAGSGLAGSGLAGSGLAGQAGGPPADGPCRLAIVGPGPRNLALARKVVARGMPWRGRSDLWFTPRPLLSGPGQVAFFFPGFESGFVPRLDGVAEAFGLPAPRLHGDGPGNEAGAGVVEHALDVIAVSRLFAAALAGLGITPDVLAGHSLGEWTAMMVAGMYPEIDAFMASMRPGMVEVPDVVYAALGVSADRAAKLAGGADVVVSHDNCPHQSVVCGPAGPVADVIQRARAARILAQTLPFRTGFHSPMYAPYLAAARETLARLEVRPPDVPIWSATSLAPFPRDPDQVRELVLRHLVEPVRFRQLTELLYESGVRAFVQVGLGSLTGYAEDTLRDREHLTVATAVRQRGGLAQLRRVAAALWADGLSPRFSRLDRAASPVSASLAGQTPYGASLAGQTPYGASLAGQTPYGASLAGQTPYGASLAGETPYGGGSVRLRLGAPLVRLAGAVEPVTTPADVGMPVHTPVLAELSAVMTEAAVAAQSVTRALAEPGQELAGQPVSAGQPYPGDQAPRSRSEEKLPGDRRPGGDDAVTTTREFSLRTMPDIADHCIFPQAQGWPDDSDRFPVVPMTTLLEVMADAALEVAPGLVVTGFEQVTATRWLTVAPATTARCRAARDGEGQVRVSIEGYASGRVLVSADYPPPPPPAAAVLHGERPAPVTAGELYADRWMFHGPRFAGLADIASVADDGITGTVLSMPARGALLDSAGQLIGHWMQVSCTVDQTVLPTGIRAVRLYGPQPPAGARLGTVAWIREVTRTEMRADAELRTADGRVWCRVDGWTTRRFATDDAIWQVKFRPERNILSCPATGGWTVLWERWPDTASRELMMRSYLNATERARYERLNPLQQRWSLLGTIAVKDSVRRWLWDRGAGPIYPAEITVGDISCDGGDVRGASPQPCVRGPFRAPSVSLRYRPPDGAGRACAVAIAGDEPVGFTLGAGSDGTLLVTQHGRPAVPIEGGSPATEHAGKGNS
jgi:3-oxoacyl-(acyl-carrier-protein) synthase